MKTIDLDPDQLAEAQRLFTACERARQAYQEWYRTLLAARGVDADKERIDFNPWTGRFTVAERPPMTDPP